MRFAQIPSSVSARKAKLRLSDDSDSDGESSRQKQAAAAVRRKGASGERQSAAAAKPPASARSVPHLALDRVPGGEDGTDFSSRSTLRGTVSARSSARVPGSTFSTPRHDATAMDMRRAMIFNDSDDEDSTDRILKAASQRLQLGSSVNSIKRTPRAQARATPNSSLQLTILATPAAPDDVVVQRAAIDDGNNGAVVAHSAPVAPGFFSLGNNYRPAGAAASQASKAQQSRLEQVIGYISDDEDAPVSATIFKRRKEPEPVPGPNHVEEHHFEVRLFSCRRANLTCC